MYISSVASEHMKFNDLPSLTIRLDDNKQILDTKTNYSKRLLINPI